MEPDVSIETSCVIRAVVLPIDAIPTPLFRDYSSMLVRQQTVSLSSINSFYTEHQKSPFAHQPWGSGNSCELEDDNYKGSNLILFPPADRQTQEFHLQTMMQDLAASLLMKFEKWVLQAEAGGTILKTPLDSQTNLSSEEVIKAKKRRLGRAQKTIGDYCLLAGSPADAIAHYSTALELARLTGDFFWYAGAMEGSVCALLVDCMGQKDLLLEEEVKYQYNSVILHYRKSFIQENAQRVHP